MKSKANARRVEVLVPRREEAAAARAKPLEDARSSAAALGVLVGLGPSGEAWVDVPRQGRKNVPMRSTVALQPEHVGREVLLACFETGEAVISGIIQKADEASPARASAPQLEARVDADRIVFSAEREVVLRCGEASILLSADGSVVIKGAKLLTSSTGVHRIRGGSVQIN
ncbi:MAG TPA: DUF6484 domain-containing protein [Polyangiaceae bacterium]|nr:DUF6484 domain-containing protein [Polyangiaceae bacterium]